MKTHSKAVGLRRHRYPGLLAAILLAPLTALHADEPFVKQGVAGFVVADIKYALAPNDAPQNGACPSGMVRNTEEIFASTPKGRRHKGESDKAYATRLQEGSRPLLTAPNGENVCMHPEAARPDPFFQTVRGSGIPVFGIDLDGRVSADDFIGVNGEKGIDNQFYRVVGCSHSFQSTGASNSFAITMLTGAWGVLLTLSNVDDIRNDDHVEVGIYANADPVQLSPTRVPLAYATYAIDQNPHFRATAHGHIKDGVLTTEPTDILLHSVVNGMYLERPLLAARIQATLSKEGVLEGYLAGYTPVEAMYDLQYGYRNGKTSSGALAPLPLRLGTANGAARVLHHTCNGAYYALYQYADGNPDPATGRFTSISTQYRFKAIPAFVVDVKTQSVNARLDKNAAYHSAY